MDSDINIKSLSSITDELENILTPQALEFASFLHRTFNPIRLDLLEQRKIRQIEIILLRKHTNYRKN